MCIKQRSLHLWQSKIKLRKRDHAIYIQLNMTFILCHTSLGRLFCHWGDFFDTGETCNVEQCLVTGETRPALSIILCYFPYSAFCRLLLLIVKGLLWYRRAILTLFRGSGTAHRRVSVSISFYSIKSL